jgi:2-octaprenyl-6-methoxyphenol hydroxylase
MDTSRYDIAISGAGPVGCTLALLLATKTNAPQRIALIGKQFGARALPPAASVSADPRTLALNHGSRVLLESLGAWPRQSAAIETVHVSQQGRLGRTLIKHSELGVPCLGSVVSYDALLGELQAAVSASGIDVIHATPAVTPAAGHLHIDLDGRQVSTAVMVQSDGSKPSGIQRTYHQHAILATVAASLPRHAWAFERFTDQGPLAALPHPAGPGVYGIVWCSSPQNTQRLQRLDDRRFEAELSAAFGDRLGRLSCMGARHEFELSMHLGPSLVNARTVAIGNAAQTLHPVAGQGLNLGLRDAAQLAHVLSPWLCRPSADPGPSLAAFVRNRRPDRWLTVGITDLLPRLFATRNPFIQHACGLGLLGLDLAAPARDLIARQLLQGLRS